MAVQVMKPGTRQDRERIYRFLYEIWSDEFCRSMEGMDHEQRCLKDELDESAQYLIAVDDRTGRMIGCIRFNILGKTVLPENLEQHLSSVRLIEIFGRESICYVSRFAVAPEARGRTVASLLISALYKITLETEVMIGISFCALDHVAFYSQLGYRHYGNNFRLDAGIRVPIVLCVRDLTYLREVKSPLARFCPKELDDRGEAAGTLQEKFPAFKVPDFPRAKLHHLWACLAHTAPNDREMDKSTFFEGLSEKEQKIIGRRISEIDFSQGEYVYRRGEEEKGMGLLLSGSLGVELTAAGGPRIINALLPGDPFGEISSLGGKRRSADLVALEDSKALLFPHDFLDQVSRADTKLGYKLSQRLLKILASRFVNVMDTAIHQSASLAASAQSHQPSLGQPAGGSENVIDSRQDSYRFGSLGDQEGELKRLKSQATIGEDIEFSYLSKLGLRDGLTILDLGSGPGVTSLLMAKRLRQATIIGVEPEDRLRQQAEKLIADQLRQDHCRFVKGSGDRIPLGNQTVDFSYARLLFQHLSKPIEVLQEMRRVTRSGGVIVVFDVDDKTNIIHPEPAGLAELEQRIADSQALAGGDRYVGRKLYGYMQQIGLLNVGVELVPITAAALGREAFFSIVYSFKRQVLERAGLLDESTRVFFDRLGKSIRQPTTFAATTVYVAHGLVP